MDSKTITPEGNVDVSHYNVTVINDDEGLEESSGYIGKGEVFTVKEVPAGFWKAKVDAYVLNDGAVDDDGYILVASAESEVALVEAGKKATITVILEELLDSLSGDVEVTLLMPSVMDGEGTPFNYSYTISGMGSRTGWSYQSDIIPGTVSDGRYTFTVDAEAAELLQGAYLLTVSVFDGDSEASSGIARKGVEVMRLLPGLSASGTISLDSQITSTEGFEIEVIDRIGDRIDLADGAWNDEAASMAVGYDGDADDISVYIDGLPAAEGSYEVTSDGSASVSYTFKGLPGGRHVLTFIVDEPDTELGVGSLTVEVSIPLNIEFNPASGDSSQQP